MRDTRYPQFLIRDRRHRLIQGLVALLLLPLAATSSNAMMRRLGRHWKRLHQLVYLCAIGGVLHFLWQVKADFREPLVYLSLLCLLLAARLPKLSRIGERWRRSLSLS